MPADRFPEAERRMLLNTTGIGEIVVHRLESAGFTSLQALREAGAQQATERVLQQVGQVAWLNRRRAIERAILRAAESACTP